MRDLLREVMKLSKVDISPIQVFEKAINTFGETHQKIVAMEEMGELIQAISKDRRGKEHNVEEEIADVEIMCKQLRLMYDSDKVDQFVFDKIERLKGVVW